MHSRWRESAHELLFYIATAYQAVSHNEIGGEI